MRVTKKDMHEVSAIAKLLKEMDSMEPQYITSTSEQMEQYQPFMLSMLLGYNFDMRTEEVEEIMKIYFLIWEYFKSKKNIKKRELTEFQFEKAQKRNIDFFKYLDGETSEQDFNNTTSLDLGNLQSKALLTGVLLRFDTIPILLNMNGDMKGMVMIGIKSLIECFEEIVGE